MAMLVYADADGVERSFMVGMEPVLIGRATECAIRSSDPRVSRNHARFYLDHAGTLYIEDLGSSNGIYVGQNRVMHSAVPYNEYVVVGSLVFRLVPDARPEPPPQPPAGHGWVQPDTQPAAHAYGHAGVPSPYGAPQPAPPYEPPPAPAPMAYEPAPAPAPPAPVSYEPPPLQGPPSVVVDLNANELAAERTARQSAEQERDAYGARMAELHGELRTLREATDAERARLLTDLSNAQRRVQQLEAQLGTGDPAAVAAEARANAALEELAQVTDQLKSAEARERSMEEELGVARTDLEAAEQRIVSELAAHEEQLTVTRADLIKAEERILDLSRTVSELEQKLATR